MLESTPGDVQDLHIPLDTAEPLRYRQVCATALASPEMTVSAETQYNIISLCSDMNRAERDLLRISSRLSLIKMEIVPRRQCQGCSSRSLSVRDANVQSTICPGLDSEKRSRPPVSALSRYDRNSSGKSHTLNSCHMMAHTTHSCVL